MIEIKNNNVMGICECGALIQVDDVRCPKCALVTGPDGAVWDMGTKHICASCPAARGDCKHAFEHDPGNGLCPADYDEEV
jgi:hypothetical protein